MSVGGWLTENHHRPVAAPRDISAELSTGTAAGGAPNCSPGRSHNRIGQGGSGSAWGICQHNSAPQRPLICDTPTPLTVETELPRPGRESTSRACTRRRGREVDSHVLRTEMARTPPPRRGGVGPGHVSPGQTPLHTYTSRTDAVRHGAVQRRIWRFAGTRTGTRQQLVGTLPRRNQHATAS